MVKSLKITLCLIVLTALSGCSQEAVIKKFLPERIDQYARNSIHLVKQGNVSKLLDEIDPSIRNDKSADLIAEMSRYMDKGDIVDIVTLGVHLNKSDDVTEYKISYQIEYPHAWQIVDIAVVDRTFEQKIIGFLINDIPAPIEELNRFTFKNKTATHYLMVGLYLAYFLVIAFAFITCVRTKHLRLKWLWAIVTFIGVGQFLFNWTTGTFSFQLFSFGFQIPGFFPPSPYQPFIIQFYIPLGSIIFLVYRFGKFKNSIPKPPQPPKLQENAGSNEQEGERSHSSQPYV